MRQRVRQYVVGAFAMLALAPSGGAQAQQRNVTLDCPSQQGRDGFAVAVDYAARTMSIFFLLRATGEMQESGRNNMPMEVNDQTLVARSHSGAGFTEYWTLDRYSGILTYRGNAEPGYYGPCRERVQGQRRF